MNKQLSYLLQHRVRRRKGDTAQLAAQLAPLEEQKQQGDSGQRGDNPGVTQEYGAIVVGNKSVHLSEDIMEGGGRGGILGMEPVVLVILAVMLAFIAFIAWQVSQMPAQ